jgi:hypothetical protein
MLDIIKFSPNRNNGADVISGRGLGRRKLTPAQRVGLAADFACGQRHLEPSLGQLAALLGVTSSELREELKTRAQREAERRAAEARQRSQAEAETVNAEAEILADTWRSASPESREVAIRLLGPGAVWDALARVVA